MTKARTLADLIADGVVGNAELDDGSVTLAKIANGAIGTDKIADAAVTAAKLNVQGSDIPYDNSTSGISANTLQEAIDYLNVLSGGGSAGAQATYTREEFNATAGQTTFTTANGYTLGYLQVFLNGIMLDSSDYTANDESTVVLGTGAAAGDEVTTIAYDSFAISELLRVNNVSASAPDNSLTIDATGGLTTKGNFKAQVYGNASVSTQYGTGLEAKIAAYANETALELPSPSVLFKLRGKAGAVDTLTIGATYGGTEREGVVLDHLGRVTMPYQPHFLVNDYGQVKTSSWQKLVFANTVDVNVGGHYSTSTSNFTAPVAGVYFFSVGGYINANNSTERYAFDLRVNGSGGTYIGGGTQAAVDAPLASFARTIALNANDYVGVWMYTPNTETLGASYHRMWFNGYLIS